MIPHCTFVDATARSADDLLADLEACRALRHVSNADKEAIVRFFFGDIQHSLREGKKLPGTGQFFVSTQQAFEEAFSIHGASCDICGSIEEVPEKKWRRLAERSLKNMDGDVHLMLCYLCDGRFSNFCSRYFQREVRIPWSRDLEQMMVAFIAFELGTEARRILSGRPPRKRNYEQAVGRKDCGNREAVTPRCHDTGSLILGRREPPNRHEIQEGLRQ